MRVDRYLAGLTLVLGAVVAVPMAAWTRTPAPEASVHAPLDEAIPLDWATPPLARDAAPVPAGDAYFGLDWAPPVLGEATPAGDGYFGLDWSGPALGGVVADGRVAAAVTALVADPGLWREARDFPAVAAAYAARGNAPVWIEDGAWRASAAAAIARIARAGEDGLDAAAYHLPALGADDPVSQARADVELSLAVARYAREAQSGRVEPRSLSRLLTAAPEKPDAARVLAEVSAAADAATVLDRFNPPHEGFRRLKAKLADLRDAAPVRPLPAIAPGRLLRPGMEDARVPALRERLGLGPSDGLLYDDALVEAVRAFQRASGLADEGVVGRQTLEALNAEPSGDQRSAVLVNMERWRWLPRDLGRTHVFVNIPEYRARVIKDGASVHETRVVVGTPRNQTPVFSDAIRFLIVNPAWNVPYSIASKEMLPKLQQDPTWLARQGIEVVQVRGNRRVVLDSTAIDWTATSLKGLHFRQPPGERNALGHIKFMFPNEHAVYLHDTPSRNLFARPARAFSHGCVRVEDPFALAEVLLGAENGWSKDKVRRMVGGGERRINLPAPVPVHLAYVTAEVDDAGALRRQADIYGHDARLGAALGLAGQGQPRTASAD